MIAAVVLAAGRSTRMGRPKLLLPMADGRPMLAHPIEVLRLAGAAPIVVVGGPEPGLAQAAESMGAFVVHGSQDGDADMLASIQAGLRAVGPSEAEAAMILPGDMPFIRAATIQKLVEAFVSGRPRLLAPSFGRRRGHPVCLAREVWPEVEALTAPQTLRDYMRQHSQEIQYVLVEDPGVLKDVDQPDDYKGALDSGETS